ncbi:MAG: translesion error-prone DNA polymerase V autoproteolytic subunit [Bdellovibrionota bacterium]
MQALENDPLSKKELGATGFASPADDYLELPLDLNSYMISNPAATFFVRAKGNSADRLGIFHGDLLVVDRSRAPSHGNIVIAVIDGEFTFRMLKKNEQGFLLIAPDQSTQLASQTDFEVWGVISYIIHRV